MNNPEIIVKNAPFKHFCMSIGAIPTSYKDSLDYYETLLWLIKYLEETIIPTVNNNGEAVSELQRLYIELKNFVDNYFTNLDVQEEINNKLDDMVEDGTLETIIAKYIKFPYSYLTLKKVGRIIDETLLNNSEADGFYGMQGGCMVDDNTYVFISNKHDENNSYADETSLIRKISLSTGEVLSENIITVGHGNGLAYDKINQIYYVACAHGNITSADYSNKIIKLDSSFNLIDTITTTINYDSLCFYENNLYAGVTYKGDLTYGKKIFKLDLETLEPTETINLNFPYNIGTGQDFCIYDNLIYFLQSSPNSIIVFTMDGTCLTTQLLKNGNVSYIGECENINSIGNNKFIIGSRFQPTGNLFDISQIFEINTLINEIDEKNIESESLKWNKRTVYINNNVTKWNPDGSSDNPYYAIDEVLNLNYKQPLEIILVGGSEYPVCRINSFNGEISVQNGSTITCGVGYNEIVLRNTKLYLNYIGGIPSLNLNINSDIKLYRCTLNPTNENYLIYLDKNSTCELERNTFNVETDLTNALFENNHGLFIWNKDNQEPTDLPSITKWFIGSVNFVKPIHLFHGTKAISEIITANNNVFNMFKQFEIVFSDSFRAFIPTYNANNNLLYGNLSTGGTGNNNINNVNAKISNAGITFEKANRITFNSSGEMTVNITPSITITDVYGY